MNKQKKWSEMNKKEKRSAVVGLTILTLIILALIGAGSGAKKSADELGASNNIQTNSQSSSSQPTRKNEDKNPHFSDGTYRIGVEIQPGTYRTRKASEGCYYERMADFTGGINSILANGNTDAPEVVTILASDAGFKSKDCGTWTQDLSSITTSPNSFTDGTYIVGTDIQPGTYKSSGQSSCYWSRLSDFTGGINSILANDNTDTPTIVTITSTDKGFHARRCGTWTKQ